MRPIFGVDLPGFPKPGRSDAPKCGMYPDVESQFAGFRWLSYNKSFQQLPAFFGRRIAVAPLTGGVD